MNRLLPLLILSLLFASCERKTNKAVVGITVTNEAGIPIQNCSVKLQIPGGTEEVWGVDHFFGTTDIDGYIEFDNTVNAYFDVYVWKGLWEGLAANRSSGRQRKAEARVSNDSN